MQTYPEINLIYTSSQPISLIPLPCLQFTVYSPDLERKKREKPKYASIILVKACLKMQAMFHNNLPHFRSNRD